MIQLGADRLGYAIHCALTGILIMIGVERIRQRFISIVQDTLSLKSRGCDYLLYHHAVLRAAFVVPTLRTKATISHSERDLATQDLEFLKAFAGHRRVSAPWSGSDKSAHVCMFYISIAAPHST